MALVPLGDRILVKRSDDDEQTTSGGIIIPDTAKEKPQEGEVIAVGNGRLLDSGERQPVDVAVGDLVLLPNMAALKLLMTIANISSCAKMIF